LKLYPRVCYRGSTHCTWVEIFILIYALVHAQCGRILDILHLASELRRVNVKPRNKKDSRIT
jgi:hypothetical protein